MALRHGIKAPMCLLEKVQLLSRQAKGCVKLASITTLLCANEYTVLQAKPGSPSMSAVKSVKRYARVHSFEV